MKKLTKNLLAVVLILCALVVASLSVLIFSTSSGYKTDKDYIYYFNTGTKTIPAGSQVEVVNDIVQIENTDFRSIPLYSSEDIILTSDMIYYPLSSYLLEKVDSMSVVTTESPLIRFSKDTKSVKKQPGLLYDGERVYVLLDDMQLKFNDKTVSLSALSYLYYDGFIVSYYDFSGQVKGGEMLLKEEVTLKGENLTLSINEGIIDDGKVNQLMFTDPSQLDSIFGN